MRKLILLTMVVVMAFTLMGGLALAGGWTTISYTLSHDPNDTIVPNGTAIWNPNEATPRSPHGLYSSTSNKCRVCHAVHEANSNSWRLLAATSSLDACDVCHGPTGLTRMRPYGTKTYVVKGEHTRSTVSQLIPDSTVTTSLPSGLSCNSCHTVHGANSLIGFGVVDGGAGWDAAILRRNPNADAQILAIGASGAASLSEVNTSISAKRSNYCADCHNKNQNWDEIPDSDPRPNGTSHVVGPAAEGSMLVEGATTTVAWTATTTGCTSCHSAPNTGNLWSVGATNTAASAFPHQTIGSKLLADAFSQGAVATVVGDGQRVLPEMDKVCGSCHSQDGLLPGAGAGGVGISF